MDGLKCSLQHSKRHRQSGLLHWCHATPHIWENQKRTLLWNDPIIPYNPKKLYNRVRYRIVYHYRILRTFVILGLIIYRYRF